MERFPFSYINLLFRVSFENRNIYIFRYLPLSNENRKVNKMNMKNIISQVYRARMKVLYAALPLSVIGAMVVLPPMIPHKQISNLEQMTYEGCQRLDYLRKLAAGDKIFTLAEENEMYSRMGFDNPELEAAFSKFVEYNAKDLKSTSGICYKARNEGYPQTVPVTMGGLNYYSPSIMVLRPFIEQGIRNYEVEK